MTIPRHSVLSAHRVVADVIAELLDRGYRVRFRAHGKSMHPTIREGEAVTVEPVAPSAVKAGDIVLYRVARGVIAHRVVGIERQPGGAMTGSSAPGHPGPFLLRGDAVDCPDEPVQEAQVLGRVVAVQREGRRIDLTRRTATLSRALRRVAARLRRRAAYRWSAAAPILAALLLVAVHRGTAGAQTPGIGLSSASSANTGSGTPTSLTFSHTVSGSNRLLVVGVSIRGSATVSTVTYAGTSLSNVGVRSNGTVVRMEIWRLLAPAEGTANVVVTVSSGARFVAGAVSFTGVNQTSPLGTFVSNVGSDDTPTVNVTGVQVGEVVIDTFAKRRHRAGDSVSADGGQTARWTNATTNGDDDLNVLGGASTEPSPVGGGTVTMSWSLGDGRDWAIGAVAIRPSAPTAATLADFAATADEAGVLLHWRTGYEINNLGFHLYREQDGRLVRLTPSLVAGSALFAGAGTALTAGRSYAWHDAPGLSPVRYWLEDVDLNGRRTWHGPISPVPGSGAEREGGLGPLNVGAAGGWPLSDAPMRQRPGQASLLSRLGCGDSVTSLTASSAGPVQRWASEPAGNSKRLAAQWALSAWPAVKLGVREEGWYRAGQPELVAAGLDPGVNPRDLQLFVDGEQVAILVRGEQDGRFDPGDAIEFYGVGLDTPSTDTRVYWLVAGGSRGKRIKLLDQKRGKPGPGSFPFTVERKPRTLYFAALRNGDAENFFGPVIATEAVTQSVSLLHLDPAPPGNAMLEVALQGVTAQPHTVRVALNGADVGAVVFDGQVQGLARLLVQQALLREGENLVTLAAQGGESDVSLVDRIRLTYWHTYTAEADALRFTAPGGRSVTVDGFSAWPIRVVDVTDPRLPQEVPGAVTPWGAGYAITVTAPGRGSRTLLAFTDARVMRPAGATANRPSAWHQAGSGAELVIIAHGSFLESVHPLKARREAQGWTGAVIDVDDVYDEFSYGHKSPKALRDFLSHAGARWQRPPRFLLLVGDASFDPRNHLGLGSFDFVPTRLVDTQFLETACDDCHGDGVPGIAVGRLPVRTAAEATTVISKIVGYDQADPGAWSTQALLVADRNDVFDFEAATVEVGGLIPATIAVEGIFVGQTDIGTARSELLARLNEGRLLVNYTGHGSVEMWRGGLLTSADARSLTNSLRLPLFLIMNCLNGLFHDAYTESLAEALLKATQGGALAVWASSGLTEPDGQAILSRELVRHLFQEAGLTLGEAMVRAKALVEDRDVRRTWILFGDPTTRLK